MKNIFKLSLAAALVASTAGVSHADLTYQGAVGLPLNPTAQLPAQGAARVQLNYNDAGETIAGISGDYQLGGLAAAARIGTSQFEVNGVIQQGRLKLQGESDKSTGFGVGLKYLISRESEPAGVRLAVGAGYNDIPLGFDGLDLENTYAYFVATKSLNAIQEGRAPITGHLGVRWDDYDLDFGGSGSESEDKFSLFAGVEVPVTRDGQFQIVGEAQTKNIDGGKSPYSIGVRYRPAGKPFGASIGLQRQGLGDSGLYLQAGYTFGG